MKVPGITAYPHPEGIAVSHARDGSPRAIAGRRDVTYADIEKDAEGLYRGLDAYVAKYWAHNHPEAIALHASRQFKTPVSTRQIWAAYYRNRNLDRNQGQSAD